MDFKKIVENMNKLISKKNTYNFIILFLVGVLILIVSNFFKSTSTGTTPAATPTPDQPAAIGQDKSLSQYESEKRTEIKTILSKIKGIGDVEVGLSFESGEELVPATNTNTGTSVTDEKDNEGGQRKITQDNDGTTVVMSTNGSDSQPFIQKRITPRVAGVVIVAQGAENRDIKSSIVAAVSSLFAIPNYKIQVLPMK